MTSDVAGQAPPDPIGAITRLVAEAEPALAAGLIQDIVIGVAGGRAKRRRLAQALVQRPAVLRDGRSPAPRAVGDLLIALRRAGAPAVSPPCCAECGKQLRTLQRRGQDWYCAVCAVRPGTCSACGKNKVISTRDRQGRPCCEQCRDPDDRDPLLVLTSVVQALDPSLSAQVIASAAGQVFARANQLRRLAWVVEDQPGLLTGDGAQAPVPGVLRLIDCLCDAGAEKITRPACPRCHRVTRLAKRHDGQWVCRGCVARTRAVPCSRCGSAREPAARDADGGPLCPNCLVNDPANLEDCVACGRRSRVATRTADGPLCGSCRPWKIMDCAICGRTVPCTVSTATGQPWCTACQQRWARCSGCGQVRAVRGGTVDTPLCAACLPAGPFPQPPCVTCGGLERLRASGRCTRCTLDQRLRQLLDDGTGRIRAELRVLHQTLASADRPRTVLGWLSKNAAAAVLASLARGERPLTHHALDQMPPSKPVEHLRAILVATGALPARDEHLTRLEHWINATLGDLGDRDDKELLHRYAVWHLLRRLRQRNNGTPATYSQFTTIRQRVRAAIVLLDWLHARGLTLAACRQADIDAWLTSPEATHLAEAGQFIRWATTQRAAREIEYPAVKWQGPSGPLDHDERWTHARRLLHDRSLKPEDRVAGLLLLLYAQWPAAISRLTVTDIDADGGQVRLRLGQTPITLPEPLASLTTSLVATRHGHAVLGDQGTSPWLFPGGQPGRPISGDGLAQRLRRLGIRPAQTRSTALFQLATELPAAVLARTLGIHIDVAVQWQRASSGDWTRYAADVSHRNEPDS